MATFPGYEVPPELIAIREQIHRIVHDELLPIEQRIDPDAAEIPEEDFRRLTAKTKAARLWCLGAPEQHGGGLDTFAMSVLRRWYREARVRRIGEGPSEVHRMVIARSLFR